MFKVTKIGICVGSLALASATYGSISFQIAAGTLRNEGGTPINSGLVILAVSTEDASFALPTATDFLSGDDMEVARWDFSEGGGVDGEFLASKMIASYDASWDAGDPLALFWFPDLSKASAAPGADAKFGVFADPRNESTGDVWTMPADDTHLYSLQFFAEGSILNQTSFANQYVASATLDENSGLGLADVMPNPSKASAVSNSIDWDLSSAAQAYTIQRRIAGTTDWSDIGSVSGSTTNFVDDMLSPGFTYEYQVIAENGLSAFPSASNTQLPSERLVLASVATRSYVQEGFSNARRMFGQVDLAGNDAKKNVIFQASGPWLSKPEINVSGALTDPHMKVWNHPNADFNARVNIAENDDWMDRIAGETPVVDPVVIDNIQAEFGVGNRRVNIFDVDSKDASWYGQVDRGIPYSFMLTSRDGAEGPGHIGIYNTEGGTNFSDSDNRIAALATRGFLGGGVDRSNKMFGEFSVEGTPGVKKTVLIRGLGPNLTYFGLGGTDNNGDPIEDLKIAEDPSIKLWYHPDPVNNFSTRTPIAFNDDWETQSTSIPPANVQPPANITVITDLDDIKRAVQYVIDFDPRQVPFDEGSKDALLLVKLDPGVYSFLLDTKEVADSGIGLLGIYEVEVAGL